MYRVGSRAARVAAGAAICALGLAATATGIAYAEPDATDQDGLTAVKRIEKQNVADCDEFTTLTFAHFNDFHGRIAQENPDTAKFFGTIEEIRAAAGEDNTIVGASGDNIGGSLFTSAVQDDQPTIDVLNAAEIDSTSVGNHEFDKGFPDLSERVIPAADFSFLGANVYAKGTTEPAIEPYKIVEKAGLRVGIIGAVTEDTPNVVVPEGIKDLDFGDPVEAINRVADDLTDGDEANGEADVLVVQIHEGGPSGTEDLETNMAERPAFGELVEGTSPKVQAIFTGHTQVDYVFDAPVPGSAEATRPIIQSGDYARFVGRVDLDVDPETGASCAYSAEVNELTETPTEDLVAEFPRVAAIKQIVDDAVENAAVVGQEPIGEATAPLARPGEFDPEENKYVDDRSGESTITNTVANMFSDELSERTKQKVIGVQNPGGTRADLCVPSNEPDNPCRDEGFTITYAQAASILPFANTLQTTMLYGEEFKLMLEQQWSTDETGAETGRFLRLGFSDGVTYTYDETREWGDRITSVTIDGEPLSVEGEYIVGSGNFLLSGGDNFHVFKDKMPVDSGLVDLETWVDWIRNNSPLEPSFVKRGVRVSPAFPFELKIGEPTTVAVSELDFRGGYPVRNSELIATIGDVEVGRAAVVDGDVAAFTVTLPANTPADADTLTLTAPDSGTVAYLTINVAGGAAPTPGAPTPSAPSPTDPSGTPSTPGTPPKPGTPRPPLAETGGASGLIALLGAAAVTAGALVARRRRS